MTAPAQPRSVPTPGDVFPRPAAAAQPAPAPAPVPVPEPKPEPQPEPEPTTVVESIAPGKLKPGEVMRQLYQQAMRVSRMKPHSRLLALTLLGYADHRDGRLTYEPTVAQLSYATGLTDGQVKTQLQILTDRGWLDRRKPRGGARSGRVVGRLLIPALVLAQLRNRKAHAD
ncbi:helix-turn-helix DNA-binding domain protein [Streptomyces phage Kromp]|uniref:Helix-turn-helix DNA-binding domain protein n=1 Tax=Streptomyces phage Kromp TaxID=2315619 RepID=A0A386K8G9_9CAUD|nr:helix-turn-helix DNA-binding domain protein [Streptomyces phage Kromp]